MDDTLVLLCAAGTLLLRLGLALFLGGGVRAKNAAGMVLRVSADLCAATLAFWAVGLAISHPAGGFLGVDWSLLLGGGAAGVSGVRLLVVMLIASGIVAGAVSERMRFFPALAVSAVVGGLLVPLLGRWVWRGWLFERGFHDFAGGSVIHLTGAICAAVGAMMVGPRTGKYNRDGSSNMLPGHNVPLVSAGVLTMLVGWMPYVFSFAVNAGGATLAAIAMNVMLSMAAAGMASLMYGQLRFGKVDIYLCLSGLLGGLVAISAGADVVPTREAVLIGAVAGVMIPWVTVQLDMVWKIDDPSAGIATHGCGGLWGTLATGLFVSTPTWGGKLKLLGVQAVGLLAVAGTAVLISAVFFFVLKRLATLRSKDADEFDGLDLAEHDIGAYPDFQQTTIKSYHLREA